MKPLKETECRSCCPVANALDVLGDRWTLLVIRDLFMNKHEYHEFLSGPEGIATNILSDRLKRLTSTGIIDLMRHPKHKNKKLYYLTQAGKDLLPILVELILWGGVYRAVPDMAKARVEKVKRNPKKFMRETLEQLKAWEKKNL
ncbi:MAG: helix-turn-helix transcriptional regulator [Candidatus Omnitrophica bacterium]|nr:helix-turn-helix transcriptional regulator [Candidatus Omnitrophota bacterium]